MKQQFLEGKTNTIRLTVYDNNVAIVPTSAKVTLYKPTGGTALQAQADATVSATTGEMTYSLTATHTATKDLNYKAVWEYVYSSVTYYETQLFDVVKSILSIPITDNDLYNELDSLKKGNNQAKGTAGSATTSTLVDTKRKEDDNFWKGGVLEIISGTGIGQTRDITAFAQSTGTITVTPAFVTTPDTTSIYRVVKSFSPKIKQSFEKIEDMLYSKGKRHELILESSQIKFLLIYLTIHFICLDWMDEENDKWSRLAEIYEKKFTDSFNVLKLEYDEDESGFIEGGEEQGQSVSSVRVQRC
jgi:hypothetical protein